MYDDCVYGQVISGCICIVLIYVDDVLCLAPARIAQNVLGDIARQFKCKAITKLERFIGFGYEFGSDDKHRWCKINQSSYIDELLERAGMSDCNPANSPMEKNSYPVPFVENVDEDVSKQEHKNYRRDVGGLIFVAANSRIDV